MAQAGVKGAIAAALEPLIEFGQPDENQRQQGFAVRGTDAGSGTIAYYIP